MDVKSEMTYFIWKDPAVSKLESHFPSWKHQRVVDRSRRVTDGLEK